MKKIFLFDCDQTIWESVGNDYISSTFSSLKLVDGVIIREKDDKIFELRPGVKKIFKLIHDDNNAIGVISDNREDMVLSALKLFDIYKFVDPEAINIKLWKGYCPKHKMVLEIIDKLKAEPKDVYWFDDKDYLPEAKQIGVNFVRIGKDFDWSKINICKKSNQQ